MGCAETRQQKARDHDKVFYAIRSTDQGHRVTKTKTLTGSKMLTDQQKVDQVFKKMDKDFNDSLNFEEFGAYLDSLGKTTKVGRVSPSQKQLIFSDIDTDGDGHISKEEMKRYVRALR